MKEIMSINSKFMEITPKELVELVINNSKCVKGFEISVDYYNSNEVKYMIELANECSKNNLLFQIHGNSNVSLENNICFIKIVEGLSNLFDYKINIVMHSLIADTTQEAIEKTTKYLNSLTSQIDNDKVTISLENLNDIHHEDRLNKEDIVSIICNNENIYMTYDIGHEIIDFGNITDLNEALIPLISNVHLHTYSNKYEDGFDHKPIFENDEHWSQILKGILFLKNNNYKGNVVFEYDLYACIGNTIEEKIKSYISSMDYVGQRFI